MKTNDFQKIFSKYFLNIITISKILILTNNFILFLILINF